MTCLARQPNVPQINSRHNHGHQVRHGRRPPRISLRFAVTGLGTPTYVVQSVFPFRRFGSEASPDSIGWSLK
jgi:hypothetical protein